MSKIVIHNQTDLSDKKLFLKLYHMLNALINQDDKIKMTKTRVDMKTTTFVVKGVK